VRDAGAGEVCEYCGGLVAGGARGCQELMIELTVRSPDARRLVVRRTFVDAYSLQHVETQCPWPRDLAAHLLNLCCAMEYGGNLDIYSGMTAWLSRAKGLPELDAPRFRGQMTVIDAAAAETIDDYIDAVRKWGRCVWEAWYDHHDTVRGWIDEIRAR
jgi:hypothetical protein